MPLPLHEWDYLGRDSVPPRFSVSAMLAAGPVFFINYAGGFGPSDCGAFLIFDEAFTDVLSSVAFGTCVDPESFLQGERGTATVLDDENVIAVMPELTATRFNVRVQNDANDSQGTTNLETSRYADSPPFLLRESLPALGDSEFIFAHDWLALVDPEPQQAPGVDILPFHEMPQAGSCSSSETVLCLNNDRFALSVEWVDATGRGPGTVVTAEPGDTGLFWFFDEEQWDLLVKVFNGCGINGSIWVLAAATPIEYTLTVEDTFDGEVRTYSPAPVAAPILDTEAFATCP